MLDLKKIEWNFVKEKLPKSGDIVIAFSKKNNKCYVSKFFRGELNPTFCDLSTYSYYESPTLKFNGYNSVPDISCWVHVENILPFLIPE